MAARLLLADDSVTIQRVIELTFADEDVEVLAVGDGDAAIARLDSDPPDIVLADVGMPGRSGYEVAAHVKATPALSRIPVLLLTGAFEPVDEARAAQAGCAGVLVKPFEPQMVIARVRELLASRGPLPAAAAVPAVPVSTPAVSQPRVELPPPAPAPAARPPASVDDYFQQLDEAFASLNATLEPGTRPETPTIAPPRAQSPVASSVPVPGTTAAAPLTMADAFGALLGVEQGQEAPVFPDTWMPVVSEDFVDQVARRVADQVGERLLRDLAPDIVTRIAERLVREEIERIKAEAEGS